MNTYDVIIIGSGFAGLCSAIKLKESGIKNFIILEREKELGGTWWRNDYPGAAVDVLSQLYSYSFAPFKWKRRYAKQAEILDYTNHIIDSYGLREKGVANADVSQTKYCEESASWTVKTKAGKSYRAAIVINAIGHLSQPAIAKIDGQEGFQGETMHTGRWNHDFDCQGKNIAIIGSGASALQVIPAIAKQAKSLTVFQRTPHWILPRNDRTLSLIEKSLQAIPVTRRLNRELTYWKQESRVVAFQYFPKLLQRISRPEGLEHLKNQVTDEKLRARLTPDYAIGCKRILISDEYYPAICRDNVELVSDGIDHINSSGIKGKSDIQYDVDLIVYATGFHAFTSTKCLPFDIIGRNGRSLRQDWKELPHAYLGMTVPHYPNLFNINGPNTGIGHTSAIVMIEAQVSHIVKAVTAFQKHSLRTIEIKRTVEGKYNRGLKKKFGRSVWANGGCQSWYLNEQGVNTAIYPSFTFQYVNQCNNFQLRDYHVTAPQKSVSFANNKFTVPLIG